MAENDSFKYASVKVSLLNSLHFIGWLWNSRCLLASQLCNTCVNLLSSNTLITNHNKKKQMNEL